MRHIFRFEIMLRCLGVITIVFGISVVARGDGPAAGKHEKDAVSGTEGHETSGKSSTLEIIDGIVESGANRQSEIYREIKKNDVLNGRIATAYLRKRVLGDPSKRNDRRMRVCLEILQCMPDPDSLPVLENLSSAKTSDPCHPDGIPTENEATGRE